MTSTAWRGTPADAHARAAGEGRFAMDAPSGPEASPVMFTGLLRGRDVAKIRMCETAHA